MSGLKYMGTCLFKVIWISLFSQPFQFVMKTALTLCLILLSIQLSQATHLLGGYIQAKPIAVSTGSYQITVVVYMNSGIPASSQTTSLSICFGDGSSALATRTSQQIIPLDKTGLYPGVNVSLYTINHSYAGPGTYTLTTSLLNRTSSVNITNSATQQEPLTLTTTFSTLSATNQTPNLSIPATGFEISVNQKATLSLKATDTDGDSLAYGLTKSLTSNGNDLCNHRQITSYQFPNDLTRQGTFKLNNRTGDLLWEAPTQPGYYSIAIVVNEYRNGILISQTTQEFPLIVDDLPGTSGIIPPYEAAVEGTSTGLVTAVEEREDVNFRLITFPNPIDDRLQVVIQTSNPTTATVQLSDANGRKLHELTFPRMARQHEQVISLSSLTPGVYLIQAVVGERTLVRKVVKR